MYWNEFNYFDNGREFFFFFVYSYLDKVGKQPSDDNLILDKIKTFIFSTYNYFNICPKTINFNLVYFFT